MRQFWVVLGLCLGACSYQPQVATVKLHPWGDGLAAVWGSLDEANHLRIVAALSHTPCGRTHTWMDAKGRRFSLRPLTPRGRCRGFLASTMAGGVLRTGQAKACLDQQGRWQLVQAPTQ